MMTRPQFETFYSLACQPRIRAAARTILVDSYAAAVPDVYEARVRSLMETAFDRLEEAQRDEHRFALAAAELRQDLFRKGEPDFWFNAVYSTYKHSVKPQHRMQRLSPWLRGPRILDFGCGDGLTGLEMQKAGYEPYLTDVLDYRSPAAHGLPFRPSADPASIAYPEQVFDSAVLFAVLHHVANQDLPGLLKNLHRSARRVILEEDCYGVDEDLALRAHPCCDQDQLALFRSHSDLDQRRLLAFIDYFANAITQGLPQMNMPFNFRSVAEWHSLFARHGFRVEHTLLMGFQTGLFNRSCHVWFVLESV